ncbi:hypothetical protein DVK02_03610 [Halobellus sp. Atlit-31R]|nr:hypothetical protein DVK02_03610 [Halobellus sp. Atlit-31R]
MAGKLNATRRRLLAGLGGAISMGAGFTALSGSAVGASATISSQNPGAVKNDRGDLTRVTIDPAFRVEWEGLDTAVGKVFVLFEGRTREDGQWSDWSPIFRMTPWLTPSTKTLSGVDTSKPGTTGFYELNDPLSQIMERDAASRGNAGTSSGYLDDGRAEDPRALPRPIEVVNEFGRPDYENADFGDHPTSASTYLAGSSMGAADAATEYLDSWELSGPEDVPVGTGDSSLPGPNGDLPLVNNFPGAEAGYYGAAQSTDHFDVDEDGASDTDTVQIRYTFALQSMNSSMRGFLSDDFGEGWLEYVRSDDVVEDGSGNSVLLMNGTDGYPDITNRGANGPGSIDYDAYQSVASDHPSVISTTSQFTVTVKNETASSTVSGGGSGTGAEGTGR